MQRFSEKAPTEAVVLEFNFAAALAAGEKLTGVPTVVIASIWGADTMAAALAPGVVGLDPTSTQVLVPVAGGLDQNDYAISVTCTTSNPEKTLGWSGLLPVRQYPSVSQT